MSLSIYSNFNTSASFINSTSTLGNFRENLRLNYRCSFKKNHALDWERTNILKSVCTESKFVLDSKKKQKQQKKKQVLGVFPFEIGVFYAAAVIQYIGRPTRQIRISHNVGLKSILPLHHGPR